MMFSFKISKYKNYITELKRYPTHIFMKIRNLKIAQSISPLQDATTVFFLQM